MKYTDLKKKIIENTLISTEEFRKHVHNAESFVLDDLKTGHKYAFTSFKEYREPIGEHDGYTYVYELNATNLPPNSNVKLAWFGSYSSQGGAELYCEFKDFYFVAEETMVFYGCLNENHNVPWHNDSNDLDLPKILKILKQYNIPDWGVVSHFGKLTEKTDFSFEAIRISKTGDTFKIHFVCDGVQYTCRGNAPETGENDWKYYISESYT